MSKITADPADFVKHLTALEAFVGFLVTQGVAQERAELYRAVAIAGGLRLYARTGMRPNRAWTPTAMMRVAREITGRTFPARAYTEAADALSAWAEAHK